MSDNAAQSSKLKLSLDLRFVSLALLLVIAAMLLIWKPWSGPAGTRTVEVTGDATVTAKPDEFVFSPAYEFKNADKAAALAALSQKSDEIVAKLKSLGVDDSKIKTNSSGYDMPTYYDGTDTKDATYTLQLTVTTSSIALTQKVQDYLVTTSPTGGVSPQADFSDKKRKSLESQARDEATKDARSKGDQMAKNLGFSLGKVKAVDDSAGFGGIFPMSASRGSALMAQDSASSNAASSYTVQPGENDLNYNVTVTYFIR